MGVLGSEKCVHAYGGGGGAAAKRGAGKSSSEEGVGATVPTLRLLVHGDVSRLFLGMAAASTVSVRMHCRGNRVSPHAYAQETSAWPCPPRQSVACMRACESAPLHARMHALMPRC
eukprot:65009-Chlamydomonas_euryale.AAC.4